MARTKQTRRKMPATAEAIRLALQAKASGVTTFKHTTADPKKAKGSDYITPADSPEYSDQEDNDKKDNDSEDENNYPNYPTTSPHPPSDNEDDQDGALSQMVIV